MNNAAEKSRRRCWFCPRHEEVWERPGLRTVCLPELPDKPATWDRELGRRFGAKVSESLVETWAGVKGELPLVEGVQRERFGSRSSCNSEA